MNCQLLLGNALRVLPSLPTGTIQTCITSPPYLGLRDYGAPGQIGLEKTVDDYIRNLTCVFREVKRVLRDDGTLWVNIGDCYGAGSRKSNKPQGKSTNGRDLPMDSRAQGFDKQLIGVPWRLAFALQEDGWYLRNDIIWSKPNVTPESVKDRLTKSHEYIFLLAKSKQYYFDYKAIMEPSATYDEYERDRDNTKTNNTPGRTRMGGLTKNNYEMRRKRDVWLVSVASYKGAHFAVFPPALIEPCVLAGSAEGNTVLDPFMGSGTTGEVALQQGRNFVGIELNSDYLALAQERLEPWL